MHRFSHGFAHYAGPRVNLFLNKMYVCFFSGIVSALRSSVLACQ